MDELRKWRKTQPGRKGSINDTRNEEQDNNKWTNMSKAMADAIDKQVENTLSHRIKEAEAGPLNFSYIHIPE